MNHKTAVILAAGAGTRMKSAKPKVLHEVCGVPMVKHVVNQVRLAGIDDIVVVVGHEAQKVMSGMNDKDIKYAVQTEQLGTGHAVMQAIDCLPENGDVFVLCGDTPLITSDTIEQFSEYHSESDHDMTVLTAVIDNPFGYGRIVRDESGNLQRIVEQKDANETERDICEINSGMYVLDADFLRKNIKNLSCDNAQKEYYITDLTAIAVDEGRGAGAFITSDNDEIMGVNDRVQLSEATSVMKRRIVRKHMLAGVTVIDPDSVYIEGNVKISNDTEIRPGVELRGDTVIGSRCVIGRDTVIENSTVGDDTQILKSVILESNVGNGTKIGPFSYLRPGSNVGDKCKVGDFVELKNATLSDGSKAAHLAYIGDADVGKNVNIGCGVIFANYDGKHKHKTEVEDNVFIGSNSNLVAPVHVAEDAYIAAGTTVTKDVEAGALCVGRAKESQISGWVERKGLSRKEK